MSLMIQEDNCKMLYHTGIFLDPIWGNILAPSLFKNDEKLTQKAYVIPKCLVLHFGENFMKIRTSIAKLQIHENLHKNVNENVLGQKKKKKFCFRFLARKKHGR